MITEPAGGGLAGALRGWRTRRRVSRLEPATRAGTTQRHLSCIESGRSVPGRSVPARSMIIQLAESLEVPIRERDDLLLAAGFAPVYPETDLGDPRLAPIRTALERVLDGHLPYPAVVVDRHGDLALANAAFHALTAGAAPHLLRPPGGVPRSCCTRRARATHRQPRRVGLAHHRPRPRRERAQPGRPAPQPGRRTHRSRPRPARATHRTTSASPYPCA